MRQKKGVGVCNLPTGVDSILMPQTTSISTACVASPNNVRISVTANDSGFTVDIDKDLDIGSVETEDADNDTPVPREQTSVHVDEIQPQETEPLKLETSKRKMIGFYTMKTQALRTPRVLIAFHDDDNDKPQAKEMRKRVLQDALEQPIQEPGSVQAPLQTGLLSLYLKTVNVKITSQPEHVKIVGDTDTQTRVLTTASSEHSATGVSNSELVSGKSAADTVSVSPDTPTVMIVSDSQKSVEVQCSSLTHNALTQRSDVSMASTIAMRSTEEPSRIQITSGRWL